MLIKISLVLVAYVLLVCIYKYITQPKSSFKEFILSESPAGVSHWKFWNPDSGAIGGMTAGTILAIVFAVIMNIS